MHCNWRRVHASRNSFAVLSAACEREGIILHPVEAPADDVTCYSINSVNEPFLRDEIRDAKCITVAGGPHATACPHEVAEYADYVVVGEGEYTLPKLLDRIEQGKSGQICGVATRDFFEPVTACTLLDAYPAFSDVKGYIEISRGCPFSCGYCQTPQIFGHGMRHRTIDAICRDADRHRQARFISPNAFAYGSDGIHPRWEKIERLFRKLPHEIFFGTFPSEVRPEFVCDESLSLVNQYCTNTKLHFGAQSGSDSILEHLQRGHSVADVIHAVELCTGYSVTPVVDFIVGFPFETDEDQSATVDLIRWVSRFGKVHVHRFIPLPGTPLAGTTARPLLPETEKICGKLAFEGRLTGSWDDPEIRFSR